MMNSEIINFLNDEITNKHFKLKDKIWESNLLQRNVIEFIWEEPCKYAWETNWRKNGRSPCIWFKKLVKLKPCLLTSRVNAANLTACRALENSGFHLIECYLELEHNLKDIPPVKTEYRISPFIESELYQLEKIALESFRYSRFHLDPEINKMDADRSRAEWVKNACLGRAEWVLVSHEGNVPSGFVICMKNTLKQQLIGKLDLIAVHPTHRGRNIGYHLTVAFLTYCKNQGYSSAQVGTQSHNIPP